MALEFKADGTGIPGQQFVQEINNKVDNEDFDKIANIVNTYGAKIQKGSYVGTGTSGSDNPNILTFDFEPKIVFLNNNGKYFTSPLIYGMSFTHIFSLNSSGDIGNSSIIQVKWEGNSVEWYDYYNYASLQLNSSGATYYYVAIG